MAFKQVLPVNIPENNQTKKIYRQTKKEDKNKQMLQKLKKKGNIIFLLKNHIQMRNMNNFQKVL